jgi:hypothetical protein
MKTYIIIMFLVFSGVANAFSLWEVKGKNIRWGVETITLDVDESMLVFGTRAEVEAVITNAFSLWKKETVLPLNAEIWWTKGCKAKVDDYNCIYACLDESECPGRPSSNASNTFPSVSNGVIIDADIIVNMVDQPIELADTKNSFNLERILDHEFGHLLGIYHSEVTEAIMYGRMNKKDQAATKLHQDDIDAVNALYGNWSPVEEISCSVRSVGSGRGNVVYMLLFILFLIASKYIINNQKRRFVMRNVIILVSVLLMGCDLEEFLESLQSSESDREEEIVLDAGEDAGEDEILLGDDNEILESYPCYVGNIHVGEEDDLEEIYDMKCIEGNLSISYTDDIHEVVLPNLESIYGNFTITYNELLTRIDIPGLLSVDGPLMITMNEYLPTCEGYKVAAVVISNDGFLGSGKLISGNALDDCTISTECYQWDVIIENQEDMDKFSRLSCIKKTVEIESDSLVSVEFPNLYRLGNMISINNSQSVMNLNIPYLKYTRGINIVNNPSLSTCYVKDFVDEVRDRAPEGDVGSVTIYGNLDDGC